MLRGESASQLVEEKDCSLSLLCLDTLNKRRDGASWRGGGGIHEEGVGTLEVGRDELMKGGERKV